VHKRRRSLPREGVRKLQRSLDPEFTKANLKVGRDTLFNILRKHNMLTLRKKYSSRTTNSLHRFYKYHNIIKDLQVTKANQVWVSDITYIRTVKGFCYLALITDMHSRNKTFEKTRNQNEKITGAETLVILFFENASNDIKLKHLLKRYPVAFL
jgi:transposase InsO family protein